MTPDQYEDEHEWLEDRNTRLALGLAVWDDPDAEDLDPDHLDDWGDDV